MNFTERVDANSVQGVVSVYTVLSSSGIDTYPATWRLQRRRGELLLTGNFGGVELRRNLGASEGEDWSSVLNARMLRSAIVAAQNESLILRVHDRFVEVEVTGAHFRLPVVTDAPFEYPRPPGMALSFAGAGLISASQIGSSIGGAESDRSEPIAAKVRLDDINLSISTTDSLNLVEAQVGGRSLQGRVDEVASVYPSHLRIANAFLGEYEASVIEVGVYEGRLVLRSESTSVTVPGVAGRSFPDFDDRVFLGGDVATIDAEGLRRALRVEGALLGQDPVVEIQMTADHAVVRGATGDGASVRLEVAASGPRGASLRLRRVTLANWLRAVHDNQVVLQCARDRPIVRFSATSPVLTNLTMALMRT